MNFGENKEVFVRFSTDNWTSYFDRPATFQEAPDHIYDIYSFDIDLPTRASHIDFCLCYKVNESTFWDSNDGRNYSIKRPEIPKPQLSKREAFMNRRNGKADAMKRLNEVDWSKFEKLEEKTHVKFMI